MIRTDLIVARSRTHVAQGEQDPRRKGERMAARALIAEPDVSRRTVRRRTDVARQKHTEANPYKEMRRPTCCVLVNGAPPPPQSS